MAITVLQVIILFPPQTKLTSYAHALIPVEKSFRALLKLGYLVFAHTKPANSAFNALWLDARALNIRR